MELIQQTISVLVPMILSLSVHEYAHARAAFALGDDTAASMGRMTLNPLSHIDLFGTIILPMIAIVSGSGFFFGWAKPVPISPVRFTRRISMKLGVLITAAAGPISNVAFAFVLGILYTILTKARVVDAPFWVVITGQEARWMAEAIEVRRRRSSRWSPEIRSRLSSRDARTAASGFFRSWTSMLSSRCRSWSASSRRLDLLIHSRSSFCASSCILASFLVMGCSSPYSCSARALIRQISDRSLPTVLATVLPDYAF